MDIKERVQKVIDKYRSRLIKERDEFEAKMRDTEYVYGFGGPYMRQEAARDKRDKPPDSVTRTINAMKAVAAIDEFEVFSRIKLRDKKTGKIYR